MKNRVLRLWLVLCGAVVFTSPICAQIAALRGQVMDEQAAVIRGAQVTLVAADGKKRTTASNANGEFTFPSVPPGIYKLSVESKDFQTYLEDNLQFPMAAPSLKIIMKVAAVNAETTVQAETGGVSVEPDQNMSAIVLDQKLIQELLPDNEDDLLVFLQGLAGGTGNARVMVDGFNSGTIPRREAISQIRINQNLFSAEFADGGEDEGRIEIITKPGYSEWRGTVGLGFRNSALDARNAFALGKPDLDQRRYTFSFGGPLIHKKFEFLLNLERTQIDGSGVVTATTLSGPFSTNVPAANESTSVSLRSGLLVNAKHIFNFNYNYRHRNRVSSEFVQSFGDSGGGSSFTLPERASDILDHRHRFYITETFLINARMVHEARFQMEHNVTERTAKTQAVAINVLDAFQSGGSTCCPNNNRQEDIEFQDYLTITLKKHTVKAGFQLQYEKNHNLSASNFNGTYTFSTLEQYRHVLNGDLVPVDPANPNGPKTLATPTQFTLNRGNPLLRYGQSEASWFVQDDFRMRQNLALSFGLRHEFQQHLPDKLNFAPRFSFAWSPSKHRKTVIRGGTGVFFNQLGVGTYANTLRFDNVTQQTITILNPVYLNPLPADLSALSANINVQQQRTTRQVLDEHLRAPYSINSTLSLEHQWPRSLVTTISYSVNHGIHLFRTRNINAPLPTTGARPDPTQGNINEFESNGMSIRHNLTFGVQRRAGARFTFFTSYRLAWARDNTAFPADNYNLGAEWARSSGNRRQAYNLTMTTNLSHGIRLTPQFSVNSGAPFNIITGLDDNRDTQFNDRPPGVGRNADLPVSLYSSVPGLERLVSIVGGAPITLRQYLTTNFPNGVRAEGPGIVNLSTSISKTFNIGNRDGGKQAQNSQGGKKDGSGGGGSGGKRPSEPEPRFTLRLSASINNIINHVNFGQYGGVLGSPYLGRSSSALGARTFNFNLQFNF